MYWQVERRTKSVTAITMEVKGVGWEQWGLLRSDAHTDNVKNNWGLEEEHLQKALERNAFIIDAGDLFCAMQGKYDPRKDYDQLKYELKGKNYLDLLPAYAVSRYKPYAHLFAVLGMGNHEYSILDRLNTNLTERAAEGLRYAAAETGHTPQVLAMGYGGWVQFIFLITSTQKQRRTLKYYHGAGGAAPVTRGVIQTNRMAVYLPDANYVLTGHTHDNWVVPIRRERIDQRGKQYLDIQYHLRAGTYKEDYGDGSEGWHITTGKPPKILGAVWVRFWWDGKRVRQDFIPDTLDSLYV